MEAFKYSNPLNSSDMKCPRKHAFRMGKFGLSLVSTVVAIILFVGVFEVVENIRYSIWRENFDNFGWFGKITVPSENPVLMWEYRPYGEFQQIKTNRWGFRDADYESMEKPENTFRIAFAGDSITLGMSVSAQETFVRQFEAEANKVNSQRIQALNFGIDGYHAIQISELIRTKVLAFSPDIVVYAMCLNDFDFNQSSGRKIRYFKKPKSWILYRLDRLYRKLSRAEFHLYNFGKNKKVVLQSLLDVRDMLEKAGVGFQIIVLPIFTGSSFDEYPIRQMHEELGDFFVENGIRYLDLLEPFSRQGQAPQHFSFDIWHPNVEGHRFIAGQSLASILPD